MQMQRPVFFCALLLRPEKGRRAELRLLLLNRSSRAPRWRVHVPLPGKQQRRQRSPSTKAKFALANASPRRLPINLYIVPAIFTCPDSPRCAGPGRDNICPSRAAVRPDRNSGAKSCSIPRTRDGFSRQVLVGRKLKVYLGVVSVTCRFGLRPVPCKLPHRHSDRFDPRKKRNA